MKAMPKVVVTVIKKKLITVCCLILAVSLTSCKKTDANGESTVTESAAPDHDFSYSYSEQESTDSSKDDIADITDEALGKADIEFAEYLYSNGYYNSNFVVSPYAFRASLCLAAEGAQGETLTAIVKAAGFNDIDSLDRWCRYCQSSIAQKMSELDLVKEDSGINRPILALYNSVWSSKDQLGDLAYPYSSYIEKQLSAEGYSCADAELAEKLEKWISDKTENAISEIGRDVTGAASVLASTVYIDTLWQEGLEISVCEDDFTDIEGTKSRTDYIELTGEFLYSNSGGTRIAVVPMKGDMSFVCFYGSRTDLPAKISELKKETVHVMIPIFEIGSVFDADDLLNYLISTGAGETLIKADADFGSICTGGGWFIQELLQTAKISVSADAYDGKEASGKARDNAEIKQFKADGPFSFAVFSDMGTPKQLMLLYGQLAKVGQ